ncbi:DNA repair protein RecO [Thiotrichales bacterium 19S11-10]|nr:DNA repair protein RecO [Thiotrichales bacterium 19S11-10]
MIANDVGFVLHKKKYRESSLLVTLFTENHGKISGVAKGAYRKNQKKLSLFEVGYALALTFKKPKSLDGLYNIYQSELKNNKVVRANTYFKQMCCYYISELVYYLYPDAIADQKLFDAYASALDNMVSDQAHEALYLRLFETCLLDQLGYGISFLSDDEGNDLNEKSHYQLKPMALPSRLNFKHEDLSNMILSGQSLKLISRFSERNFENLDQALLSKIKQVNKLYINHLLQGRTLESRRLLIEYYNQIKR